MKNEGVMDDCRNRHCDVTMSFFSKLLVTSYDFIIFENEKIRIQYFPANYDIPSL